MYASNARARRVSGKSEPNPTHAGHEPLVSTAERDEAATSPRIHPHVERPGAQRRIDAVAGFRRLCATTATAGPTSNDLHQWVCGVRNCTPSMQKLTVSLADHHVYELKP